MTRYAVTVEYTGDVIVEADSPEQARAEVEAQLPNRSPDSDYYHAEVVDVQEEDE